MQFKKRCSRCLRVQQVERAWPCGCVVRRCAEVVRRRAAQGRRLDQEHSRRQVFVKRWCARKSSRTRAGSSACAAAGCAGNLLSDAALASHDFQTALQNYLDLEELRSEARKSWQKSLDAFDDMIRLRRRNYEPLLPQIDAQFRELDAQIRFRKQQRDHLQQRLQRLLIEPRPDRCWRRPMSASCWRPFATSERALRDDRP